MNFINLLRTWVKGHKMNDNRIRKDDLDALGDMAGMVGTYMQDYAKKADNDARGKLFKGSLNVRETLAKAILPPTDDIAQQVVPDNTRLEDVAAVLNVEVAPLKPSSQPAAVVNIPQPIPAQTLAPQYKIQTPSPLDIIDPGNQMEFGFVNYVVQNYGTVGDVIKHFDERLDKLEDHINIIHGFITELRSNMPKRRNKSKNEIETIT